MSPAVASGSPRPTRLLTDTRKGVPSRNMAEQPAVAALPGPYSCETPFERGGGLCKICKLLPESPTGRKCNRLVARSAEMVALLKKASTVANTDASVVLRGESGSG